MRFGTATAKIDNTHRSNIVSVSGEIVDLRGRINHIKEIKETLVTINVQKVGIRVGENTFTFAREDWKENPWLVEVLSDNITEDYWYTS